MQVATGAGGRIAFQPVPDPFYLDLRSPSPLAEAGVLGGRHRPCCRRQQPERYFTPPQALPREGRRAALDIRVHVHFRRLAQQMVIPPGTAEFLYSAHSRANSWCYLSSRWCVIKSRMSGGRVLTDFISWHGRGEN
ncbi:hypothetical protein PG985_002607 [Apiospora marii]|uniref:Uncharacterized protein n=1 Tax=Apiospora marii TaxID=335849 RepID=A0ABR1RTD6_9PEZI